uniref:ANK_REP_REGION domain-containing protein n=1 Tax=Macrostomum lignano TaxID=282301 RepID=A0A1I8FF02_9PLAT
MTAAAPGASTANVPMMQVACLTTGTLVDLRDARGLRPLHVASYQGHARSGFHLLLLQQGQPTAMLRPPAAASARYTSPARRGTTRLRCWAAATRTRCCAPRTAAPPLMSPANSGRFSIAQLLLSLKSVSCLLHKDLEDEQRGQARSPAPSGRQNGHVDVAQGANPNRMTEHGTCLHLAAIHGQLEAVKFLL